MGVVDQFLATLGVVRVSGLKENPAWKTNFLDFNNMLFGSKFTDFRSYQEAFKKVTWAHACVSLIATSAAMVEWYILDENDVEIEDHEVVTLLKNPNEFDDWFSFIEGASADLSLTGNTFWLLNEINKYRQPLQIYRLDPKRTKPIPDKVAFIRGYRYEGDAGSKIDFDLEDVIHTKYFNPLDQYLGMGKIEAAAMTMDTDYYSAEYNKNFFINGARLSGILQSDRDISLAEMPRIEEQVKKLYQGRKNMHKIAILGSSLKYNPTAIAQKDMEYLAGRKFTRDEICVIFNVPPPKLGIMDNANYKMEEADRTFWSECMSPHLKRLELKLDQIVKAYNPKWRFEFEEVVKEDEAKQSEVMERYLRNFVLTPNEVRDVLGYPKAPWGDSVYVPLSAIPSDPMPPEGEVEPGRVPDEELVPPRRNRRSVEGGAVKDSVAKIASLIGELGKVLPKKKDNGDPIAPVAPAIAPAEDSGSNKVREWDVARKKEFVKRSASARETLALKFRNGLKDFFNKQEERLLDRLPEFSGDLNARKLLPPAEDRMIEREARPFIGEAVSLGIGIAEGILRKAPQSAKQVGKERLNRVVASLAKRITGINDTTREEIKEVIREGLDAGLTVTEIAYGTDSFSGIAQVFDRAFDYRSEMIARTEISTAYGEAELDTYKEFGVEEKEWITAGDDRVSEECADNEAQGAIPLDEAFKSGDIHEPAHPNCRCDVLPVVNP